jgi:hypothetical protein
MCKQNIYLSKHLDLLALVVLILASISFATMIFTSARPSMAEWVRVIIVVIVVASLVRLSFNRDYYLPFLGETVFPCEPLAEKIPDKASVEVIVNVEPNSNIVYWASEENKKNIENNPITAYGHYSNSGVTRSNNDGVAILRIRKPVAYKIPSGRTLNTHVHYRVCKKGGLLGSIQTEQITL